MKIVQKITALVIATSIGLSLVSCGVNDKEYKDNNEQEIIAGEVDNNEEIKLIDEVEVYKPISEREIKIESLEDCVKIYSELEIERQRFDESMKYIYENYVLYTRYVINQSVLNTVEIYYDMILVLVQMYKLTDKMPQTTEEEIENKIEELAKLKDMYDELNKNQKDSFWTWFGDSVHIGSEQKKGIIAYVDFYDLIKQGVGGQYATTYMERDINKLTKKLEKMQNCELGI